MNQSWINILPSFLKKRLEGRHKLQNIFVNTGWLVADNILRMGFGVVISVWIARYLGPEGFGQFNYAIAFVGFFGAIASMGLNGIVVRNLLHEPGSASVILGSAFVLQVVGGLFAMALIIGAIPLFRPDNELVRTMVVIISIGLVFKASDVVKYWFESQVQSRYAVWIENGAFLMMACLKVTMILMHATLLAFVWVTLVEVILVSVGLLFIYNRLNGCLRAWQPSMVRVKSLFIDSWPLILSSVAVMIYMRIDQIMLGQMLGDDAVGIYSAAVRISEVWYFVPMAIVASVFPAILDAKKQSESLYYERLQKLYYLMVLIALTVAVPMTFFSDSLVMLVFGQRYQQAGPVLSISIWAGVSVAMSAVHGRWLLVEGLQKYGLLYTLAGAIINVMLILYLVPLLGVRGAAWATLCAQSCPIFLQLFIPKARRNFHLMFRALCFPYRFFFNGIK